MADNFLVSNLKMEDNLTAFIEHFHQSFSFAYFCVYFDVREKVHSRRQTQIAYHRFTVFLIGQSSLTTLIRCCFFQKIKITLKKYTWYRYVCWYHTWHHFLNPRQNECTGEEQHRTQVYLAVYEDFGHTF